MTLTYQGLPVIRPSPLSVEIIPHCTHCRGAVVWVLNAEGKEEPRCIDSGCPSHAARESLRLRIMLNRQKESEQVQDWRQGLMIWRCLFVGMYPMFLSLWAVLLVVYLAYRSVEFATTVAMWTKALWNGGEFEG